jgi:hypothetical protein
LWRIADGLDYVLTLVRLRILDAVAGPEPETSADQRREAGRERMQRERPPKSSRKEHRAALSLERIIAGRGNGARPSQLG